MFMYCHYCTNSICIVLKHFVLLFPIIPVLLLTTTTEPNLRCGWLSAVPGKSGYHLPGSPRTPDHQVPLWVHVVGRLPASHEQVLRDLLPSRLRDILIPSITRYRCRGPQKVLLGDECDNFSIQQCRSPIKVTEAPKKEIGLPISVYSTFISQELVNNDNSVGPASR